MVGKSGLGGTQKKLTSLYSYGDLREGGKRESFRLCDGAMQLGFQFSLEDLVCYLWEACTHSQS